MLIDLAVKAFKEITGQDTSPAIMLGTFDGIEPPELKEMLFNTNIGSGAVIVGDANIGDSKNIDTYDILIKFAEDSNFSKIRHKKFEDGTYAIILVP